MKKKFLATTLMIFSVINMHAQESNVPTKPVAKTIGGMIVCSGAVLYGAIAGPFVTLFGIADGFDGQVIVGPLITATSLPAFYFGHLLLKSSIKDLDKLEMQGISNPLKKIPNFILEKEKDIKKHSPTSTQESIKRAIP